MDAEIISELQQTELSVQSDLKNEGTQLTNKTEFLAWANRWRVTLVPETEYIEEKQV